jgi:hypothetical protein
MRQPRKRPQGQPPKPRGTDPHGPPVRESQQSRCSGVSGCIRERRPRDPPQPAGLAANQGGACQPTGRPQGPRPCLRLLSNVGVERLGIGGHLCRQEVPVVGSDRAAALSHVTAKEKAPVYGAFWKRAKGLEPSTLSLGSASRTAWINAFRSTMRKTLRSNPPETALFRQSLARNWRAVRSPFTAEQESLRWNCADPPLPVHLDCECPSPQVSTKAGHSTSTRHAGAAADSCHHSPTNSPKHCPPDDN